MSANLDTSNGRVNFAFTGDRNDIWHREGHPMGDHETFDAWLTRSGLDFEVAKVDAIAVAPWLATTGPVENFHFHARKDTGVILGHGTDAYQLVQPRETLEFVNRFVSVDDRFAFDTAGSLDGGARVWALARFRQPQEVAGEKHVARLLCTTSFDGTSATKTKLIQTRVVCANTMAVGLGERTPTVSIRHNTRFDPQHAANELAKAAKEFERYKQVGDAMATVEITATDVSRFFKEILEIPFDAPAKDISTRKLNQFGDLQRAFGTTRRERNEASGAPIHVWTALQAVTRYVDHDMGVKASVANGDEAAARFQSANFGAGETKKQLAWNLLLPRVRDLVPVAA